MGISKPDHVISRLLPGHLHLAVSWAPQIASAHPEVAPHPLPRPATSLMHLTHHCAAPARAGASKTPPSPSSSLMRPNLFIGLPSSGHLHAPSWLWLQLSFSLSDCSHVLHSCSLIPASKQEAVLLPNSSTARPSGVRLPSMGHAAICPLCPSHAASPPLSAVRLCRIPLHFTHCHRCKPLSKPCQCPGLSPTSLMLLHLTSLLFST